MFQKKPQGVQQGHRIALRHLGRGAARPCDAFLNILPEEK
jgi:hypothetical protein